MKNYNSLIIALFMGFFGSTIAQQEKSRSFSLEASTQQSLKETAKWYAYSYGLLHYYSIGLASLVAIVVTHGEMHMAKMIDEKVPLSKIITTFGRGFKGCCYDLNKRIIRTHAVAAPIVFGGTVAYNAYKEAAIDKK